MRFAGASPPAFGWAMSDAVLLGSLHNYRLWFARIEARERGEDVGDVAAERLSLRGHVVSSSRLLSVWTGMEGVRKYAYEQGSIEGRRNAHVSSGRTEADHLLLAQLAGSMAGWTVCSVITPIEHVKGSHLLSCPELPLTLPTQPSSKCRPSVQSSTPVPSTVRSRSSAPTAYQVSGTALAQPFSSAPGSAPCELSRCFARERTCANAAFAGSDPTRS